MAAAALIQGEFTMGPEKNVVDELRARIARLEREVQSRDSYIEGLILRNRSLRIDVYKHQGEVVRLRHVLRQAGLSDAARESATRLAVAPTQSLSTDVEPPSTQREPGEKRTTGDKP